MGVVSTAIFKLWNMISCILEISFTKLITNGQHEILIFFFCRWKYFFFFSEHYEICFTMDLLIQVLISISLAIIKGAQAKGNDHLLLWDAWGAVFSSVLHATVWKSEKFTLTEIFFSWNQLFSNYFSKHVGFTRLLSKLCESKFS